MDTVPASVTAPVGRAGADRSTAGETGATAGHASSVIQKKRTPTPNKAIRVDPTIDSRYFLNTCFRSSLPMILIRWSS